MNKEKHIKNCNHKNLKSKENHTVTIRLDNNKKTMFETPASKCEECGEHIKRAQKSEGKIMDLYEEFNEWGQIENAKRRNN